jgi:hypothetical protein
LAVQRPRSGDDFGSGLVRLYIPRATTIALLAFMVFLGATGALLALATHPPQARPIETLQVMGLVAGVLGAIGVTRAQGDRREALIRARLFAEQLHHITKTLQETPPHDQKIRQDAEKHLMLSQELVSVLSKAGAIDEALEIERAQSDLASALHFPME